MQALDLLRQAFGPAKGKSKAKQREDKRRVHVPKKAKAPRCSPWFVDLGKGPVRTGWPPLGAVVKMPSGMMYQVGAGGAWRRFVADGRG